MGETELEDGEACAHQDTSIDPDVALSYIDEKIHNVLGHFMKDFEGLVSVENLGAKYGDYGSFLPTYRRSPIWSHSKSPLRVQNHITSQFPKSVQLEGGRTNSLAQANVPNSVRHVSASLLAHKPPSHSDLCGETTGTQSRQPLEQCTPKPEICDRKTLKVRIKVGSDDLSVKKISDIYNGLGLDGSPSSSFDDSPVESGGVTNGMPSEAIESPAQILQMMTCFPLDGGYLLSPLPYDLIQLSEIPKILLVNPTQTSLKANLEMSVLGHRKNNKTFSGDSVVKQLDRKGLYFQVKSDEKGSSIGFDFSMKESNIDVVSCEELISDALKLPLLSNADALIGKFPKASLKIKGYSEVPKGELLEPSSIDGVLSNKLNGKANSVGNSVCNADTVDFKSTKSSKTGLKESLKKKGEKSVYCEGRKEKKSSTRDKKKSKKNKAHGFASGNEAMENGHAWELNEKNCTETENHAFRSDLRNSSMQKELSKGSDKYVDFFGDMNEQEADLMDSPDVPSRDRLKTSQVVDNATLVYENSSCERMCFSGIRRGTEAEIDLEGSSDHAALSKNSRPISDPSPAGIDMDDDWVSCDKCHKQRLLPPGYNVDRLPEKWSCSMMTWLPEMNCCSISSEDTTKALVGRCQLLPENANGIHVHVERRPSSAAAAGILDPVVLEDGELIDKLRKTSKSSFQEYPYQFLSSGKEKLQSTKDRTASDRKESPLISELKSHQLTRFDDASVETNQHNKIDKHKADCVLDEGHAKISIIKRKREPGQDYPRTSKKSKTRPMQTNRETARDEGNIILGVASDYDLAVNTVRKYQMTNSEFVSSRIPKHNLEGNSPNTNDGSTCPGVVSLHGSKTDVAPKKRKADHFQDSPKSTPSSGKLTSDNDLYKKKKHRVSESERKENSARKGKADKRLSLDNRGSLHQESSCAQPVLAATSSSSKVSSSLKAKSYIQELKGSPVESVSSSPLRISNSGKLASGSKSIVEKNIVHDVVKLAMGSPRKYDDDDYEGRGARSGPSREDVTDAGIHNGSVNDLQEKSNGGLKRGLAKISATKIHANGYAEKLGPGNGYSSEAPNPDSYVNEATGGEILLNTNVSCLEKSWKGSSLLGEDKKEMSKHNSDHDENPLERKTVHKDKKRVNKDKQKCGSNVDKTENDIRCHNQEQSTQKSKAHIGYDEMRSSMNHGAEKKPKNLVSTSKSEKSQCLPPSDEEKNVTSNCRQLYQDNDINKCTDVSASDLSKELRPNKKADNQNVTHHIMSKHSIANGHRVKNQDVPSPLRRDVYSEAAKNAIKEATTLKHLADRLKKVNGSESTGLYFEAALKFLHGASLLESGKTENVRHADVVKSIELYSSTAQLCEFCAREFEKSKDMATAALAYKCMEVAYMRVICNSHLCASRDRHELQTVLHIVPPGESPSSSASDIDNLNNSATGNKALQARSSDSTQLAADLVITTRNHPNFERLLGFTQNVNLAMEASRKSRIAYTASNVSMDHLDSKEGITSIKRALDFNFHDVDGLLRLVRLAKEVTSR